MTSSIAVVCEAASDKRTGCNLADRVICDRADWISTEVLESYRRYRDQEEFLKWIEVRVIADDLRIRAHGHFTGEPAAPDAIATRRAFLVLAHSASPPDAMILLRDVDKQPDREIGMNQARDEFRRHSPTPIVIGLARVMRECWVIAGFVPETPDEQELLQALRAGDQLGFDPTLHPERLTARTETAKKNSKRVLAILTQSDPEREIRCCQAAPLDLLRDRGAGIGLTRYLEEVDEFIVPLFV